MAFQRDPDAGRQAVVWLAVAFAVTIGTAVCIFIILAFAEQPREPFLVLGGIVAGIILFLWGMGAPREKNLSQSRLFFWLQSHKEVDPAEAYRPRRKRLYGAKPGSNQPPTLESVREISETHSRWVPHGPAPRRDRPDKR